METSNNTPDAGAQPLIERSREWWAARADREGDAVVSAGAPDVPASTTPRRIQLNKLSAAERAIYDAVLVVEAAGADVRLTDAVVLLQAARDSVADFVDGVDSRRYVTSAPVAPAAEPQPGACGPWVKGAPPKPYDREWFLAQTDSGDYVVLRPLPDHWSYDYTTADSTYIMRDRIARWAQLSCSQFVHFSPTPVAPCERCRNMTDALGFFTSVIKSGEKWSEECDKMLRAAFDTNPHHDAGARDAARGGEVTEAMIRAATALLRLRFGDDVTMQDGHDVIDAALRASDGVGGEG